jgi:PiT family inorganic phosphate transporter
MELTILLFLSSGLFLGWSLGANDAANVFGTAVGTRMVKFSTAALFCSIFVILGATIDGTGAAHTLGKLGSVNAIGGSFMAAFSAALTVYWMTKLGLPVSTSQAVVGAIIGWNLFSGSITDMNSLVKIMGTWIACPLLSACIAIPLFALTKYTIKKTKTHLIRLDAYTRTALILAGAFGSYALGANNIANVMGVFVPVSPFTDISINDSLTITGIQQLFFIGAVAIAVGVVTYSKRVMLTVGDGLMALTPVGAWVVVTAHSIVLFLFASESLEHWLAVNNLPTIPLVPVSSSQAVVGAVIGIGIYKGGKNIKWNVLGKISSGWVTTPIISAGVCFVALFFLQNVFNQKVYSPVYYEATEYVVLKSASFGVKSGDLNSVKNKVYSSATSYRDALRDKTKLSEEKITKLIDLSKISNIKISQEDVDNIEVDLIDGEQRQALNLLTNRCFIHEWQLKNSLANKSKSWEMLEETIVNKQKNKEIKHKLKFLYRSMSNKCAEQVVEE